MYPDSDSRSELQFLRFYVDTTCCSIETRSVHSIHRWEETRPAGENSAGIVANLRLAHGPVPVYSLRAILGLASHPVPAGPVLAVRTAGYTYGVQVDRIARAVAVPDSEPKQLPVAARDPLGRIRGAVRLEEELSLVLSPGRLAPPPDGLESAPEPAFAPALPWRESPPPRAGSKLICLSESEMKGETAFAFTLRQMIEITGGLRIVRLGDYNPCIYGIADWRGYVVPVIAPGSLTCLPYRTVDFSQTKFAILRGARSRELFALPAQCFAALTLPFADGAGLGGRLPATGPYVLAAYEMAGGSLVLPDLDRLVMA